MNKLKQSTIAGVTATAMLLLQVNACNQLSQEQHNCESDCVTICNHNPKEGQKNKKPCCDCTMDKAEHKRQKLLFHYDNRKFGRLRKSTLITPQDNNQQCNLRHRIQNR